MSSQQPNLDWFRPSDQPDDDANLHPIFKPPFEIVLFGLLAVAFIWNVIDGIRAFRDTTFVDLNDVRPFLEQPSTRSVWILSAIAALWIGARRWQRGWFWMRGIWQLIMISVMVLTTVAFHEIVRFPEEIQTIRATVRTCPESAISATGDAVHLPDCDGYPIGDQIWLAGSDPRDEQVPREPGAPVGDSGRYWDQMPVTSFRAWVGIQPIASTCDETTFRVLAIHDRVWLDCEEHDGVATWILPVEQRGGVIQADFVFFDPEHTPSSEPATPEATPTG